jgi:hypothetical protein
VIRKSSRRAQAGIHTRLIDAYALDRVGADPGLRLAVYLELGLYLVGEAQHAGDPFYRPLRAGAYFAGARGGDEGFIVLRPAARRVGWQVSGVAPSDGPVDLDQLISTLPTSGAGSCTARATAQSE